MVNYKPSDEKASEVVTVRLTVDQRRELDAIAKHENKSISDLIRLWINEKSSQLKRGRKRPKKGR